jgi:hypothetical protein
MRFCDDREQLYVFDKWERRVFRTSPRNVAAERAFYDLEAPDGRRLSVEGPLGELEGKTAAIISQILDREEIGFLDDSDRRTLASFAAVQHVRVRGHRERFKDMSQKLVERISASAPENAALPEPPSDEDVKLSAIHFLVDALRTLTPHFLSKAWILFEAPRDHVFWISDNPVTLHNSVPSPAPWMGNIGLAVRGIEIHLPISNHFTLAFVCPSIAESILEGHADSLLLRHGLNKHIDGAEPVGHLADGIRYGFPVPAMPGNMDRMNSLQVAQSERWVFAVSDDFTLAEAMLNDHPDLATGPRLGMS